MPEAKKTKTTAVAPKAAAKPKAATPKKAKQPKAKVAKKTTTGKAKKVDKAVKDKKAKEPDEEEVEIIEEEEAEEEESEYQVKLKPKLSKAEKASLKIRSQRKRRQPKFRRQEWFRYKRLGDSWRKPRGLHSKMRTNKKYRPNMARIGYGSPANVRGRHPSGFEEVLVHRPNDLEGINPKTQAARISHQVGTRKRIAIEDRADELGIRILNRGSL
jgi:large subunit ribosomal protein L32e